MKSSLSLFFMLVAAQICYSQSLLNKEDAIKDLDILYETINEVHPNPYTVISKNEFDRNFNSIKSSLKDSLQLSDFFAVAAPLLHSIGDGHSWMYMPQEELTREDLILFPYFVEINSVDSSLTISNDISADNQFEEIPIGAKITSINGKNYKDLLTQMLSFKSGELFEYKLTFFRDKLLFPQLLYLLDPSESFAIEYIIDGKLLKKNIDGNTIKNIFSLYQKRYPQIPKAKRPYYSMTINENNIAILDIRTFSFELLKGFSQFVDSAFTVLRNRKINNLIIDIRGNGGGATDVSDKLFKYLIPGNFKQFDFMNVKVSRQFKEEYGDFKEISKEYDPDKKYKNNIYVWNLDNTESHADSLIYKDNIYLLTDRGSFSTSGLFAWVFKYYNLGTIIGEETGGLPITFGDYYEGQLPHSKLNYTISYKELFGIGATEKDRNHGVIPHINTRSKDAMDKALEIIHLKEVELK